LMYTIVLGRLQSQEILDKMNSKGWPINLNLL
jgi:hypothetical protein